MKNYFEQDNICRKVFEKKLMNIKKVTKHVKGVSKVVQDVSLKTSLSHQRWNLKNLSLGLNPPKSAKTRFKFSAGLNLETFDTILS